MRSNIYSKFVTRPIILCWTLLLHASVISAFVSVKFKQIEYFQMNKLYSDDSLRAHESGIKIDPYPYLHGKNLVSVEECVRAQKDENLENRVVFVDASWFHKGDRNPREEFEQGPRIKHARYFDIDDVSLSNKLFPGSNPNNLPHMMPPKELFCTAMDMLDIKNTDHVIIYGTSDCSFIARTWFMFLSFGHDVNNIHLMQGSMEEFELLGGILEKSPIETLRVTDRFLGERSSSPNYVAKEPISVCNKEYIISKYIGVDENDSKKPILLDPRGSSFVKGHIPGALHVPYSSLTVKSNPLKFKPRDELLDIFKSVGVCFDDQKEIICSCGSGVSVCNLFVTLLECGYDSDKITIYDGSWIEWKNDPDTPKVI